jgi:hypothetical protein
MGRPKKNSISNEDFKSKLAKKLGIKSEQPETKSVVKPVRKLTKTEETELEDEIVGKAFRTINKIFPHSTVEHIIFDSIPAENKITRDTDIGTRVIVAKYPSFYKIYFMKYHDAGTKFYPNGGIEVYNSTYDLKQSFPLQSVAVHPTKKDKYRVTIIEE